MLYVTNMDARLLGCLCVQPVPVPAAPGIWFLHLIDSHFIHPHTHTKGGIAFPATQRRVNFVWQSLWDVPSLEAEDVCFDVLEMVVCKAQGRGTHVVAFGGDPLPSFTLSWLAQSI